MRILKTRPVAFRLLFGLLATLLLDGSARAQSADEYVLILLDRSASMGDPAVSGASLPAFWDNALAAAQARVHEDKLTKKGDGRPLRAYAVWTFFDDTCSKCSGNTQKNVKQVWPVGAGDCNADLGGRFESTTEMCVLGADQAADRMYDYLKNKVLAGLAKQRPTPLGNTPLGDSLCYGVEKLQLAAHDKTKTIILETDGGETSSTSACAGFGSVALPDDSFNKKNEGWGLTVGSWQENFLRRTVRIGRFPPRADDAQANAAQERAAVRFVRGVLLPGERLPTTLRLRIDLHYAICDPAVPSSAPCAEVDRMADPPARELSAKTGPRRPSIHPGELSFFKALVGGLPGSDLRELVRVPASSLGIKHKLHGDVDDSGCVDEADLELVTAKNVWFTRAVASNDKAVRADLNRDGWVNQKDAAMLLSTWGKGCAKGTVGKKPALPE